MAPGEKEELVAALIALGGGIVAGLAGMTLAVIVLGQFGVYGPPNVGIAVLFGFFLGVITGKKCSAGACHPPGRSSKPNA